MCLIFRNCFRFWREDQFWRDAFPNGSGSWTEIFWTSAKTGVLVRGIFDLEEKIRDVCQLAYKNGVEEWKKQNGILGDGIRIEAEEVNPSLKNWEDALTAMVQKGGN